MNNLRNIGAGEIKLDPSLITFYPSYYQELYSETSKYFQLIKSIFEANRYEQDKNNYYHHRIIILYTGRLHRKRPF